MKDLEDNGLMQGSLFFREKYHSCNDEKEEDLKMMIGILILLLFTVTGIVMLVTGVITLGWIGGALLSAADTILTMYLIVYLIRKLIYR